MPINCAIVDDESLALRLLADYVEKSPLLRLVGKFNRAIQVLPLLQAGAVDLLFLDIQMPELTGLELLKTLKTKPLVVLTTAYSEFAAESYALDVTDYLLKPVTFERFLQAVNKASELLALRARATTPVPASVPARGGYLLAKADQKLHRIAHADILYIEGLKEYVSIYTAQNQRIITLETLKNLEDDLPQPPFIRCHKSYIANLDRVTAVVDNHLEINKKLISIGASYKAAVLAALG
ncbi:MAG: LytTR family DNA-binding domain-containing protein [Bernardetiaceae bacterium]|jgi:DNA-binding LytR/AlgR family response regulator|nr:LytTR family DNA-binding domain-containing protein [Bernardetiaceae bacterium]